MQRELIDCNKEILVVGEDSYGGKFGYIKNSASCNLIVRKSEARRLIKLVLCNESLICPIINCE